MLFNIVSPSNWYKYIWSEPSFGGYREKICEACGRKIFDEPIYFEQIHHFVLDGGKRFPDVLQVCGYSEERWFVLSKRALEAFEADGITGIYKTEPVIIDGEFTDIPDYYIAHINGSVEFSLKDMFLKKKRLCPVCGQFDWNRGRMYPVYLDLSKWSGDDVCRLPGMGHIICSEKIVKSVKRNKLTGFAFEEYRTVSGED